MADAAHTDVAWIMKRNYSDDKSMEIATRDHPSYYELPKKQGMQGSDFRYVVQTGNPQSISGTFTSAQDGANGNSGIIQGSVFAAEPALKYGVLKLDGPSMLRATTEGKGAFFDFVTRHADGVLEELGARLGFDLFGDGNGIRGQRSSISSNTVTLTAARTAERFKRGMIVGASANSDGSSPRSGSTYVTKIDRSANSITLADASQIASFTDADYLFAVGEPGTCIDGMADCTPLATPTSSDSFRSVNRSVDAEALAGCRVDNTGIYPEEVLGDLAVDVHCLNKKLTRGVMHPIKFQEVVKRLGAKVEYTAPGGNADIGFESIMIHAAGSAMRIVSDPDIGLTRTRAWNPRSHLLRYLGPSPVHWIRTAGGGQFQWSTSTDGIEMRARFYGNYLQPDPSEHAVGSVAE